METPSDLTSRLGAALPRLTRYLVVGGSVNLVLYAGYIGVTAMGLRPEIATSIAFMIGIGLSFTLNRAWAFKNRESVLRTGPLYVCAYATGFGVQLLTLSVLHRGYDVPHYAAQLVAMVAAAVTIFLALHFWVFRGTTANR